MQGLEPRRGRPRKFAVPSRAVTLTLPDEVIDSLKAVDPDISRAVVRLLQARGRDAAKGRKTGPAELTRFGKHAVIVVRPTRTLAERTGVELVPLPDGRALISFRQPQSAAELELLLEDALDDPALPADDAAIFGAVLDILRGARRSRDVVLTERSIIVLETRPAPRRGTR